MVNGSGRPGSSRAPNEPGGSDIPASTFPVANARNCQQ